MIATTFARLGLAESLLRALEDANYQAPTPIQARSIPILLDGFDLLGIAQTGTGKTVAFVLPLLDNLDDDDRRAGPRSANALILTPTRELAIQISDSVATYGRHMRLKHAVVMGGVGMRPQVDALRRGVDALIATPGRLLDLIGQGHVDLSSTEYLVLDEADRMLDMGFIRDVRRIVDHLPLERQTLLFSATMPADVARLAREILFEPKRVEVASQTVTLGSIVQRVHHMDRAAKSARLIELLAGPGFDRVIIFTRTKRGADRVVKALARGGIAAEALHGNKSQNARIQALDRFRQGHARVLVATDIASRGIDVDNVTHVINYELPDVPESYVHRIGRTARAGASGVAISFCDPEEHAQLHAIERFIKRPLDPVGAGVVARSQSPVANIMGASSRSRQAARKPRRRSRSYERRAAEGERAVFRQLTP